MVDTVDGGRIKEEDIIVDAIIMIITSLIREYIIMITGITIGTIKH